MGGVEKPTNTRPVMAENKWVLKFLAIENPSAYAM
jgi:hypothetical protein